ncbi:class I SAM-dependent methyltransferase [Rhodocytophaga aerolata]|uniref:Class I SAM-dependent methyltransferase n=1 Tax=Rhodocytophaga aerolata TaxID=455078 RepID=A0ABT8R447_9BACT|nr:class I SAM-dependent methyltransferase [Rhodocytophaga aerolata]MDO1445420.1 class I SAM-dependent methyltransferase [Rhodocytophaga aerolata]
MKKILINLFSHPFKKRFLRIQDNQKEGFKQFASPNSAFRFFFDVDTNTTNVYEHTALFTLAAITSGNVLELGTYIGKTAIVMASAFPANSPRKVYTIDTFTREIGDESSREKHLFKNISQYDLCNKLISENKVADKIEVLKGTTDQYAESLSKIPNIQLIFVDADHSYEAVKRDLVNYAFILEEGGYLAMHDYLYQQDGVKRAVDEFVTTHTEFKQLFLLGSILVLQRNKRMH